MKIWERIDKWGLGKNQISQNQQNDYCIPFNNITEWQSFILADHNGIKPATKARGTIGKFQTHGDWTIHFGMISVSLKKQRRK
jgi:hypothetical protein